MGTFSHAEPPPVSGTAPMDLGPVEDLLRRSDSHGTYDGSWVSLQVAIAAFVPDLLDEIKGLRKTVAVLDAHLLASDE